MAAEPFLIATEPVGRLEFAAFVEGAQTAGRLRHPGAPPTDEGEILRRFRSSGEETLGPAVQVSWFDAWSYAASNGVRLPTVAELSFDVAHLHDDRCGAACGSDGVADVGARVWGVDSAGDRGWSDASNPGSVW